MALTESAIKNAKPAEKVYRLTDEYGLFIEIRPTGKRVVNHFSERKLSHSLI